MGLAWPPARGDTRPEALAATALEATILGRPHQGARGTDGPGVGDGPLNPPARRSVRCPRSCHTAPNAPPQGIVFGTPLVERPCGAAPAGPNGTHPRPAAAERQAPLGNPPPTRGRVAQKSARLSRNLSQKRHETVPTSGYTNAPALRTNLCQQCVTDCVNSERQPASTRRAEPARARCLALSRPAHGTRRYAQGKAAPRGQPGEQYQAPALHQRPVARGQLRRELPHARARPVEPPQRPKPARADPPRARPAPLLLQPSVKGPPRTGSACCAPRRRCPTVTKTA